MYFPGVLMVFSSLLFTFCLLPLFLVADSGARLLRANALRNSALLGVSLLFYTWGEAANVLILLAMGGMNWLAGWGLARTRRPKLLLAASIAVNLGVLFFFKYAFWLISLTVPGIVLETRGIPLGISFFTFHAISYLVDLYRGHIGPARNALDFMTYFCMFPHLVAGPIVRYAQVAGELRTRGPDRDLFAFGVFRFLVGLNKKVLIANSVSILADSAFTVSAASGLGSVDAWIGCVAYTIQIYFDFSGYSDMAIGLAAMAGFRFEENFKRPYSSVSIRDFWRRWHISLATWFRDYLYIPLGGSKKTEVVTYRNLLLVFLLCGLWHGASFNFVIWGLWHGMFLVLERLPFGRVLESLPRLVTRAYTLLVVMFGWIFFRAECLNDAIRYLGQMFSFSFTPSILFYHAAAPLFLVVGVMLCLLPDKVIAAPTSRNPAAFTMGTFVLQALLAVASVGLLVVGTRNPFIYFNF